MSFLAVALDRAKPAPGLSRSPETSAAGSGPVETPPLEPGDWVEVRPEREIFSTLDKHDKYLGLQFTKEMSRFCGGRYRVLKMVKQILVESTGEMRPLRIPTAILENVVCDGAYHGGCDRTCYIFWREAWLKKAREGPL